MKKPTTRAEAFEAILKPRIPALYKTAYRLTGSREAAEDLVQDVLIKLYPKTADIQKLEAPDPWFKKALYRQFIDDIRKRSRRPEGRLSGGEGFVENMKSPGVDPEKMLEISEIREKLDNALNILDDDGRAVVVMHLVEGYTLSEIAEIFGKPEETIKTRLRRAKVRLKKFLKSEPVF